MMLLRIDIDSLIRKAYMFLVNVRFCSVVASAAIFLHFGLLYKER